ncbi:MAG: HPr(Ser) kinase/phosphatase [Elusimicrobia bacterium]|nr:HPr(Ser) kinase/phosphatase [Elusimicrobiota bacterium]
MPLSVEEFFKEKGNDLQLEILSGSQGLQREIAVIDLNRPGLALGGFLENFRWERIQVIGRGEHAYINHITQKQSLEPLKSFLKFKTPCLILTHNSRPKTELIELSNQFQVPLFVSGLQTATLIAELSNYLEEKLSPTITIHGVLVEVYGLGVLISGNSGIGKSECALELIKRGHMLVSDDVVKVQHRSGGILIGKPANEMIKHHMEVRGLGIIDVKQLFGVSAILDFSRIELAIHLEMWDETKEYDRVGLEEHSLEVLGVRIPRIIMPVRPGRNLAILIEVAALYQRLKARGINAAQEMENNLLNSFTKSSQQTQTQTKQVSQSVTRQSREGQGKTPYRRR